MKNTSTFQIVVMIIFAVFAMVGVGFFATQKSNTDGGGGPVSIWGTLESRTMGALIGSVLGSDGVKNVSYRYFPEDSFDTSLMEALSEGRGPDIIMLSTDRILRHREKIVTIPFESMSERSYIDAFVDGASVFRMNNGYIGLPMLVDPIVMYWNKSIFINEGILKPPAYWDEFNSLATKLTKKDQALNIDSSFVAFGEFANVDHAKDILSMLMLQAGSPIVTINNEGKPLNYLTYQDKNRLIPADTALRFYTEFADSSKSIYSWNRSLPSSLKAFLAGDLAIYFGYASEVTSIRKSNPNLNFDVAVVPQIRDSIEKSTYGKFTALSLLSSSKNRAGAFSVLTALTTNNALKFLVENTSFPPVGKILLSQTPTDPYMSIFYSSAIISKSWLDPNSKKTDKIFSDMVSDVTSGRLRINESIKKAYDILDVTLKDTISN